VTGRGHERRELRVGDRAGRDAVRRDLDLAHRPLLGVVGVVAADVRESAGERNQAGVSRGFRRLGLRRALCARLETG
jgi:hypothetical protein